MNRAFKLTQFRFIASAFIVPLFCLSLQGCVKHEYKAAPISKLNLLNEINSWSVNNPDLNRFLQLNGISKEALESHVFSIERLFLTSLYYDPKMRVAYQQWRKAKIVSEHSQHNINPELSIPFEHHSDSADGKSEWTIGAVLSFIYERKDKREARSDKAKVALLNAKLAMTKIAFARYGIFEEKYHEYIANYAKITETKNEIEALKKLQKQLQENYELGAISQFELSTIRLELQERLFRLSLQENKQQKNVDDLFSMTHVAYSELDGFEIEYKQPLLFAKKTYQETELLDANFSDLQKRMLDSHLDMAISLNKYAQSEAELRLEIESQYPDLVLSPGFIFDQSDNIWALGASWVLPLFEHTKQNLNILAALEERKIKQEEIVLLQRSLLSELYKKHKAIIRNKSAIALSDEIIASIEQQAKELQKQVEIGGIDNIALLRNKIEFHRAKQVQIDVYDNAIIAILEIEHLLQDSHSELDINKAVSLWLTYLEEKNSNEPIN